ncbi:cation-transporting P-type ATPase [Bacteriovoracaceae bacterium]|nr:cation-transporting P-type ATPase [Bacteriovoracaceae bacterium]
MSKEIKYWNIDASEATLSLDSDSVSGLTESQVLQKVSEYGSNALTNLKKTSKLQVIINQFKSLIVLLLLITATISFVIGEITESLSIFIVILINAAIGAITENKAIKSVEALKKLGTTQTQVLRDGKTFLIDSKLLVPGDIVKLEAGDSITADMRIIEASKLTCNEAILTGESLPVEKIELPLKGDIILNERKNMLYKGTFITTGTAKALITSTGMNTEVGKISRLTQNATSETTPLEKKLDKLGQQLLIVSFFIAIIVTLFGVTTGKPFLLMIETAIVLAIATIPEGLPIVSTLALAKGMWIMAKNNALVNKLSAVETLGATSIIFTDKTGTLTENKMTVVNALKSNPQSDQFLKISTLCNNAELNLDDKHIGDPMEVALLEYSKSLGLQKKDLMNSYPEIKEVAFDSEILMMATIHQVKEEIYYAIKGAPERIIERSNFINLQEGEVPFTKELKEKWIQSNTHLANEGKRLIAFASKKEKDLGNETYKDICFQGLVAFEDPPRHDIKETIKNCHQAGINVIMVTGDQEGTATKIGLEIGILKNRTDSVINGKNLHNIDKLSSEEKTKVLETRIFSRVSPEQKLKLIELFQESGKIVAMTGDGVNDAPALKKADIGIAMGLRGTQVAKEAADMILLDDSFKTIISAVKQGRIIFVNIRRFVIYLLSCNFSEVMVVSIAALLKSPLPLVPLSILFLNLVTDVFPALALGMGNGDNDYLKSKPRDKLAAILSKQDWALIFSYGIILTAFISGAYYYSLNILKAEISQARTVAFISLALAQTFHVFNMKRAKANFLINDITKNIYVWAAIILCIVLSLSTIYIPILRETLQLSKLTNELWQVLWIASLGPIVLIQLLIQLLKFGIKE